MIHFILNNQTISTAEPPGTTVLDFVRYHKNLKGTKIGCREGDCGACTVLVGEAKGDGVSYRTMTSCLMPLANASGKHIVTVEGINPENRGMTPVQQAMVDESGTQCGFCTVGFVMSLTGFCVDDTAKTPHMAVSAVDGNICRCTGYKSIERAARGICERLAVSSEQASAASVGSLTTAIDLAVVPRYFGDIAQRLRGLRTENGDATPTPATPARPFVSGGTDVYVQRPEEMAEADARHLFYDDRLRGIRDTGEYVEMGGSTTVTDLLVSPVMQSIFPDLYKHLKLVSSTPIRNMATLAGNFINASPIGDMTVWFLALDAEIALATGAQASRLPTPQGGVESSPAFKGGVDAASADGAVVPARQLRLRDLYLGYKQLAKAEDEYITAIRFKKPTGDLRFNFEKVCKRTYLDIATVNTAISLTLRSAPGKNWVPPALSEPEAVATGASRLDVCYMIEQAHVSAGGVAPIPLYLKETSAFLNGKEVSTETIAKANEVMQAEISPISDVRGTEAYKRLLLRQLFTAHFHEMLGVDKL